MDDLSHVGLFLKAKKLRVTTSLDGTIVSFNSDFSAVTGYTREDLIGARASKLRLDSMPKEFFTDLWITIRGGDIWHGAFPSVSKNGSVVWSTGIIYPIFNEYMDVVAFASERILCTEIEKNAAMQMIKEKYGKDV